MIAAAPSTEFIMKTMLDFVKAQGDAKVAEI